MLVAQAGQQPGQRPPAQPPYDVADELGKAVNSPRSVALLNDKLAMRTLLRDKGISAVRYATADHWTGVAELLPAFELPVVVKPAALVCLGATAGQQLLGSHIRIGRDRGRPVESDLAELVTVTTHPSAILRAEDEDREQAMAQFVDDLKQVAKWLSAK